MSTRPRHTQSHQCSNAALNEESYRTVRLAVRESGRSATGDRSHFVICQMSIFRWHVGNARIRQTHLRSHSPCFLPADPPVRHPAFASAETPRRSSVAKPEERAPASIFSIATRPCQIDGKLKLFSSATHAFVCVPHRKLASRQILSPSGNRNAQINRFY